MGEPIPGRGTDWGSLLKRPCKRFWKMVRSESWKDKDSKSSESDNLEPFVRIHRTWLLIRCSGVGNGVVEDDFQVFGCGTGWVVAQLTEVEITGGQVWDQGRWKWQVFWTCWVEIHMIYPSGGTVSGYVDLELRIQVWAGDTNLGGTTGCKEKYPWWTPPHVG